MSSTTASGVLALLARRRVALGFVTTLAVLWLGRPSWPSWALGLVVALVGEGVRVWAAGHLEKSREVTRSGPYRFTRHPLYLGSAVIALGVVLASRSVVVAVLAVLYVGATIGAAIVTEERFLRRRFGDLYDRYQRAEDEPMMRRFSMARAMRNREYRAVAGVLAGFTLLALKIALPI